MHRNGKVRFAQTAPRRATSLICLWVLTWLACPQLATAQLQPRPSTGTPPSGPGYTPRTGDQPRPFRNPARPDQALLHRPVTPEQPRQGLIVNGREAAAASRDTANTCTVAILGAVQQPGVYQFDRRTIEPIDLIRAAAGPTAQASGSIQVIRMGARVPQQRSAFLTPRLKLPLETNDLVVLHRADEHVSRPAENQPSSFDALGRPVFSGSATTIPAQSTTRQPLIPTRIGILGVAEHPLVFELHPDQSSLAAVLSRLNQDGNRQATALVLTPNQPQAIVAWSDAGSVPLKDGSLVLFKGDEIDAEALPEFPLPRRAGSDAATTQSPAPSSSSKTSETRPSGPVVLNSPFSQRSTALAAANPAGDVPVAILGDAAPLAQVAPGVITQAGNRQVDERDARPNRGSRADFEHNGDLARPQGGMVEAAPDLATRPLPTDRNTRRPLGRIARNPNGGEYSESMSIPTPDEPPLPGDSVPTLAVPEESTSALHEEPLRIPTKARISVTDESQLDRIPAPANLGAEDVAGDRLPPAPEADIDPLTQGRAIELQGILVAALSLAGVLIGLWVAAQPHRVVARPQVTTQTPLFDRLERLLANSLPIHEEPTPLPGDINLYGRVTPMADHYLIDTPQQTPAPHFSEPAARPVPSVRTAMDAVVPAPGTGTGTPAGSGKVVRLDGSHPGNSRCGSREPGLLDRALLSKQPSSQGPTS